MRLSLRYKIVGGFVLLLSLIGLLGWVTYSLFASLGEVQRRVFDDAVPGLVVADEIVRSYTAQSAAIRGYLINSREGQLNQYHEEVREVAVTESRARALFDSPGEKRLLADLIEAGRDFHREVDKRVLPIAKDGNRALAFSRLLSGEGDRAVAEIEELGQQLRRTQGRVMERNQRGLQDRSAQALAILLLVTIGAVLIGLLLAVVVSRRLVQGLHQLVNAARAVGRGDFDQSIDIRSGDEVEELATRFNEMQAGLKRLQQLALHDRELEIAASIQKNLLQKSVPHTPEVHLAPMQRQANLVGGDWFDVESSDGRLAVVVGDASGKGIGAALMATVALSALRAERGLGGDGRRIVSRANRALVDATDPDSFATLIYLDLELATGEATWLNMGHPPPFILRASGMGDGPLGHYLEGPRNRVLGWFDDPGWEEGNATVRPGDRLVLYTDGWLEAKSVDGETFGEHRFAEALTRLGILGGEALVEELVREVERFAAGKLDDDLTILVVEFLGAPMGRGAGAELTGEEQWRSRR
ncbi:MAG: SpoIIE family protein phosphatase [Actinomycetota bacterium]|nr:SpoIIE family protein phosphatase [Actinomycetota bacterium]